jgi:hypothetical protein
MPTNPQRLLRAAALAAGLVLTSAPAHAFTVDDGSDGGNWSPKFNIEEQAKNFRKGDTDTSTALKSGVETPAGKLHFGLQQDTFGSPLDSSRARAHRRHFDRMFEPEYRFDAR